jgi:hypothetical protein
MIPLMGRGFPARVRYGIDWTARASRVLFIGCDALFGGRWKPDVRLLLG